jgi:hypothetical protein
VVDSLPRDLEARLALVAGIEVAVPARERAAGDVDPQPVAGEEPFTAIVGLDTVTANRLKCHLAERLFREIFTLDGGEESA